MKVNESSLQQEFYKILLYKKKEPSFSLSLCRKLLERLCISICLTQNLLSKNELRESNLNRWLIEMKKSYNIPKPVLAHAWTIKEYGNCAVHDHDQSNSPTTSEYTEPCITALKMFITWYGQTIVEVD